MEKKVAAVVVTYNRLKYLQNLISSLRLQTKPLDAIYVINNDSSDGTREWLEQQTDLIPINQPNVGGSGGFYRGIHEAYKDNFDFIWAMDDDVYPTRNCLLNMLSFTNSNVGIVVPERHMNGKIILAEVKHFNLSNPFAVLKTKLNISDLENRHYVDIEGMSFEGPLIRREVVEKVGLPNKDFFIFWDDSDYSYRTVLAGYKVCYAIGAILVKEDLSTQQLHKCKYRSWKEAYALRNYVYFCSHYGKNSFFTILKPIFIFSRYLLGYIKHRIMRDGYYSSTDLQMICNAYRDGIKGTLGTWK